MKITAILSLVLLCLWSVFRAFEMSYICICGNCGWIPNPWVLFPVAVFVLSVVSIARMRRQNPAALRTSFGCACAVLAVQTLGLAMYGWAIFTGADYFDLLLFIPFALSVVSVGCVWRLKRAINRKAA